MKRIKSISLFLIALFCASSVHEMQGMLKRVKQAANRQAANQSTQRAISVKEAECTALERQKPLMIFPMVMPRNEADREALKKRQAEKQEKLDEWQTRYSQCQAQNLLTHILPAIA